MNNNFKDLSKKYDILKDELFQLKNLLLSVQSFAMQTNQKLNDVITETENNKKNIPQPSLLVESSSSVEEELFIRGLPSAFCIVSGIPLLSISKLL